jgi:hypothetical protein
MEFLSFGLVRSEARVMADLVAQENTCADETYVKRLNRGRMNGPPLVNALLTPDPADIRTTFVSICLIISLPAAPKH